MFNITEGETGGLTLEYKYMGGKASRNYGGDLYGYLIYNFLKEFDHFLYKYPEGQEGEIRKEIKDSMKNPRKRINKIELIELLRTLAYAHVPSEVANKDPLSWNRYMESIEIAVMFSTLDK